MYSNKERPEIVVQVCMDISDSKTESREIEPVVCNAQYFSIAEDIIITKSTEKSYTYKQYKNSCSTCMEILIAF